MNGPESGCCKRVPPNHWNNHNRQVRENHRCGCWCHQQNQRAETAPHRVMSRAELIGLRTDLQRDGSLPNTAIRALIDSHLAAIS